jgi:hypothetical protein
MTHNRVAGTSRGPHPSPRPLQVRGGLDQSADAIGRCRSQRLVVQGRAGSGNHGGCAVSPVSVRHSHPHTRVPVIVSLGSWNPASTRPDLLIHHLIRNHPWVGRRPTDSRAWLDASVV